MYRKAKIGKTYPSRLWAQFPKVKLVAVFETISLRDERNTF